MKKHQFEEITASLSIIVALLAYQFEVNWLAGIFTAKAIFDMWCAIRFSYRAAVKKKVNPKPINQETNNPEHESI